MTVIAILRVKNHTEEHSPDIIEQGAQLRAGYLFAEIIVKIGDIATDLLKVALQNIEFVEEK